MDERPKLTLVPKREPDAVEKVRLHAKAAPRPDGMLQCPVCGGRALLRIEVGVVIRKGRRHRGTVIEKDICAICWRHRDARVVMRTGNEKPERVK